MTNSRTSFKLVMPVMMAFFAASFCDIVEIGVDRVKLEFELSNVLAQLIHSAVFLWFFIFVGSCWCNAEPHRKTEHAQYMIGHYSSWAIIPLCFLHIWNDAVWLCTSRYWQYDYPGICKPFARWCCSFKSQVELFKSFSIYQIDWINGSSSTCRSICCTIWRMENSVYCIWNCVRCYGCLASIYWDRGK